jgi:hypothetical protein
MHACTHILQRCTDPEAHCKRKLSTRALSRMVRPPRNPVVLQPQAAEHQEAGEEDGAPRLAEGDEAGPDEQDEANHAPGADGRRRRGWERDASQGIIFGVPTKARTIAGVVWMVVLTGAAVLWAVQGAEEAPYVPSVPTLAHVMVMNSTVLDAVVSLRQQVRCRNAHNLRTARTATRGTRAEFDGMRR